MKIIDGKLIAKQIKAEMAIEVKDFYNDTKRFPHLAAILVGKDAASKTYVAAKEKACKQVGFLSSVYKTPVNISEKELLETVEYVNCDKEIDGLIVQLPLPKHIDQNKVIEMINPAKDVDGFHPLNVGKMLLGLPSYLPATPYGILQLLERSKIDTTGKHCVIVGRSKIVGSPLSVLLVRKSKTGNATVTLCHSRTKNLEKFTLKADILIAAIGKDRFIKANMVKDNAIVIDVGIHRLPSTLTKSGFKLYGDVDFEEVSKKCSHITPVPGGVGPMTIVSLLQNTLLAAKKEIYRK